MSVHDFKVKAPGGTEQPLSDYRGRPMLIVNTASKCGFTPQYAGLEKLHRELGPKGLARHRLPLQPVWCAGAGG
jgi:glutathione peroxidase